jgi:hypothetical protein
MDLCFFLICRNFLQGRIASVSLMGRLELDKVLPQREVTIFAATWNMNGQVQL